MWLKTGVICPNAEAITYFVWLYFSSPRLELYNLYFLTRLLKVLSDRSKPLSNPKLHNVIESFAENNPTLGAQLMALKWLGNTASHEGSVNRTELLDAFEILEYSLSELIERRSERIALLANKLTAKHQGKK